MLGSNGKMYICEVADAQPVGEQQCTDLNCTGCNLAPPMGKPRRSEPALVEQRGILSIELPRTHPRYVQGIRVWSPSGGWPTTIRVAAPATPAALPMLTRESGSRLDRGENGRVVSENSCE